MTTPIHDICPSVAHGVHLWTLDTNSRGETNYSTKPVAGGLTERYRRTVCGYCGQAQRTT